MASFSSVNGTKMHENKPYLTDMLRDEMNFNGFVVGDWNGHAEIPGCTATNCPDAFLAGVDMYMAPKAGKAFTSPSNHRLRVATSQWPVWMRLF